MVTKHASPNAKAQVLLPPPPSTSAFGGSSNPFDALRAEIRRAGLTLTVLGQTPEGRPHIKVQGHRLAVRAWLDSCGYQMIPLLSSD